MTRSSPEPVTTASRSTARTDVQRCQYEAGNRPKKVLVLTTACPSRITPSRLRTMTPFSATA